MNQIFNTFKDLKLKIKEKFAYQTDINETHIKNIINNLLEDKTTKIYHCSVTSRFFIENEDKKINIIKNGIEFKLTNTNKIYTTYLTNNFSDIIKILIENKIQTVSDNIERTILERETNFLQELSETLKK